MKVLDFGSLNIDYTYAVSHITEQGETQTAHERTVFCGGKGLNQAIALAKAGTQVYLAGMVGREGGILLDCAGKSGVNVDFVKKCDATSGHAIIQVDAAANNCITLYSGTNRMIDKTFVDEVLQHFRKGDVLLLQNEISSLDYIIERAYEIGMKIMLNPSPYDDRLNTCDLSKISLFLSNEVEGFQITGEIEPQAILDRMMVLYPDAQVVLTLGSQGSCYRDREAFYTQESFKVDAVDTTSAGDTFTGYFITCMLEGASIPECLRAAALASAISVSRKGASVSIPARSEVRTFSCD